MQSRFRLLPTERVIWQGRAVAGAPRDWMWLLIPALLACAGGAALLFAALVARTQQPGAPQLAWMGVYFLALSAATWLAPSYLRDPCEFVLTDKRVLWRRGRLQRWIDASSISFARIHWNRARADVGHLELVRATPFGPLLRKQRLWLHDVAAPDRVLTLIDGTEPSRFAGDSQLPLTDRLPPAERVLWGDHPHGTLLSTRNVLTCLMGLGVLWVAHDYGSRAWATLVHLEGLGLQVRSWTWLLLFSATALSWLLVLSIAAGLVWHGSLRARALGHQTEYVITDRRVVIRRGRTELYLHRHHIVDIAEVPAAWGARHLFLILDAPDGRALADHGALTPLPPARDLVAPVLYELTDIEPVRKLLLQQQQAPSEHPELDDAA